jgi:hypothetical protein
MSNRVLAACMAVLFLALGVHLHPLEPSIVVLQFTFSEAAFQAVLRAWGIAGVALYRSHFPADFVLLLCYGTWGIVQGRAWAGRARGRTHAAGLVWTLPLAAVADAVENAVHLSLMDDQGGTAAWWYAAAGGAAALKWLGIVLFIVAAAMLNRVPRR